MMDPDWHSLPLKDVFDRLRTTPQGLSTADAKSQLRETGPNVIERTAGPPWYQILLHQLADPIVYVLLGAGLLAILIGKVADSFVILAVVVLNTIIGFVQEMRASQAIAALSRMVPQSATVLRDGNPTTIPAHEVVPGDVLQLQAGDQVAADMRLFEVNGLQVDESPLTGESLPVDKQETAVESEAVIACRWPSAEPWSPRAQRMAWSLPPVQPVNSVGSPDC
ncbi:HAD-IC family P-type ATPase [Halomonas sp. CKK8]|uniref:HAD-IC family P-type ATPase n=1 Tax=Halomonas sp. CKK8 TaxID=3036127 RepID=UPI0024155484|nr:HAD-IC family P-type ATPase [Halomonas sp. CKK8]WFM70761.1 HAD-IC family P-type ATPase [Halomonas sp. CKK8]